MTDIKKMIEVMQAFEEGKEIEVIRRGFTGSWALVHNPMWNWVEHDYRIKEEKPVPGVFYVVLLSGGPNNQYKNTVVWNNNLEQKALFSLRSEAKAYAEHMRGICSEGCVYRVEEVRVV